MIGFLQAFSRKHQVFVRLAGAICLTLLLALGSLFSLSRPAHASGGGGYLHTATASDTFGDYTLLDDSGASFIDGNPNALVMVTAEYHPGGSPGFDNHPLGVWYDSGAGEWGIFNEDGASMPVGATFNVFPGVGPGFVQTATTANTSGYITTLNNAALNGNPSVRLEVTQNWNPGGTGGVYNPHSIGVWYNSLSGRWTIYNEDRTAIPSGASFDVFPLTAGRYWTVVATSSNTYGDSVCFVAANNTPGENLAVTHLYSGYFTDVAGVWWDASLTEWCIFDGSGNAMPAGATFFVADLF